MRHLTRRGWIREYADEFGAVMQCPRAHAFEVASTAARLEREINGRFALLWGDPVVLAWDQAAHEWDEEAVTPFADTDFLAWPIDATGDDETAKSGCPCKSCTELRETFA